MANDFIFAEESDQEEVPDNTTEAGWKVLIVDDEREVHAVTRLALMDLVFEGKGLNFLSAYSRREAEQLISEHDDIAIVLLDVVMDTDDAGLQVAKYIRETVGNRTSRIVLRTGQPGQAPERSVVINYDINDYKAKTELTAQKLFTCVMSALRSYRDIIRVKEQLERVEHELSFYQTWLLEHQPQVRQQVADAYQRLTENND
jgi:CheY-like chemotaxis protein